MRSRPSSSLAARPRRVIFDNAKIAVKDGFGANARTTEGYAELAAHYGFETIFCNVASGNEKGLVEGLVGFSRRNFCVPIPKVRDMDELNALLRENCLEYMEHRIQGKPAKVGVLYEAEREKLYPLPPYRYDVAKRAEAKVSLYSTVRYYTNSYSVPVKYCGKHAAVKALPERIEAFYGGEVVATHQRCFRREQSISDRSERSSTIVSTNLPFSRWTELFENATMVAALVDRLTFRSHVMDMNGESYRLKASMR